MLGHLLAALLVIAAGIPLIFYFVRVRQEDLCGDTNLKAEATDYVLNGPKSSKSFEFTATSKQIEGQTTVSSSSFSRPPHELRQSLDDKQNEISSALAILKKQCPEMQAKKYYHWHILFAGVNISV